MTTNVPKVSKVLDEHHDLIKNSKHLTKGMMIPVPWNNKALVKNDLLKMYIIDSFMKVFRISAEKNPSVKLICPNPEYIEVYKILDELIDMAYGKSDIDQRIELFESLSSKASSKASYWTGLIPDIRTLSTGEDIMSWIYSVLVQSGNPLSIKS
jgi:hypothetical protein